MLAAHHERVRESLSETPRDFIVLSSQRRWWRSRGKKSTATARFAETTTMTICNTWPPTTTARPSKRPNLRGTSWTWSAPSPRLSRNCRTTKYLRHRKEYSRGRPLAGANPKSSSLIGPGRGSGLRLEIAAQPCSSPRKLRGKPGRTKQQLSPQPSDLFSSTVNRQTINSHG